MGSVGSNVASSGLRNKVQAFQDATNKNDKLIALDDLKLYLQNNTQIYESIIDPNKATIKHFFNITENKIWYQNKTGTLFMLTPDGEWLRFNKSGDVTREGKISKLDIERVIKLLNKL